MHARMCVCVYDETALSTISLLPVLLPPSLLFSSLPLSLPPPLPLSLLLSSLQTKKSNLPYRQAALLSLTL